MHFFSKDEGLPGLLVASNSGKGSGPRPTFQYSVQPIQVKPSFPPPRPMKRRSRNVI